MSVKPRPPLARYDGGHLVRRVLCGEAGRQGTRSERWCRERAGNLRRRIPRSALPCWHLSRIAARSISRFTAQPLNWSPLTAKVAPFYPATDTIDDKYPQTHSDKRTGPRVRRLQTATYASQDRRQSPAYDGRAGGGGRRGPVQDIGHRVGGRPPIPGSNLLGCPADGPPVVNKLPHASPVAVRDPRTLSKVVREKRPYSCLNALPSDMAAVLEVRDQKFDEKIGAFIGGSLSFGSGPAGCRVIDRHAGLH